MCALVFVVVAGGFACGAEPNEHLKGYSPFMGTWRHEGSVLEEAPGIPAKGTKMVVRWTWTWILDNQVVMNDWIIEYQDGKKLSGKDLIGWNAAEKKIIGGGMNSMGAMSINSSVIDGKTVTTSSEGVEGDGRKTSLKIVLKKTDEDTLTLQVVERTGGDLVGPSPVYTFKRVK
jgi:hypothetical protein